MDKAKLVMKIESYSTKDGMMLLSVNDYAVRAMLKGLVDLCDKKYSSYVKMEMTPPYRPRTTGKDSQNNLVWRLITLIANETGNELEDVELAAKERAVKRGYPYRVNKITGQIVPASMKTISTVEASYLIDELYQIAAEYEVNVEE